MSSQTFIVTLSLSKGDSGFGLESPFDKLRVTMKVWDDYDKFAVTSSFFNMKLIL